jgi:hypothetical protein
VSVSTYNELKDHIGHSISCVPYGPAKNPVNVAIECNDCYLVLLSFDKPKERKNKDAKSDTGVRSPRGRKRV